MLTVSAAKRSMRNAALPALALMGTVGAPGAAALAQSAARAAFVANNGNLEGSVTAYSIDASGAVAFVNRVVTGTRTTLSQPCAGCNATSISLSQSGKYLATGHAAGDPPLPDGITVLEVHADGTISQALQLVLMNLGSPLDVQWLSDGFLAVTRTNLGGGSQVAVYEFDAEALSLVQSEVEPSGSFTSAVALRADGAVLFANDSSGNMVTAYAVSGGSLTVIESEGAGIFPLSPGGSPNGLWLYAGGGISGGSHAIMGMYVEEDGTLALMRGSPFFSPGTSPKQVVVSSDGMYAIAGHGTDATVRTFAIDQDSGALTSTGFLFDVGTQGSLGEIAVLDDLVLAPDRDTITDGVLGLRSLTLGADGSLTPNGGPVPSQGIQPNAVVGWSPAPASCAEDLFPVGRPDGVVGPGDLGELLSQWGSCAPPCSADLFPMGKPDGVVGPSDLGQLLSAWGQCG